MGDTKKILKQLVNFSFFLIVLVVLLVIGYYFLKLRNESEGVSSDPAKVIFNN